MALRIYNSLPQQKEEFRPLDPAGKEVKMYVCGPTVYDEPHIGHLRSAYVFEVIRNWLEYSGYKVKFVRNVTDVDDKIIEKARQEKWADLKAATADVSSRYFDLYKRDLAALGIREPSVEPRATTHVAPMQNLISRLIQKGFAYHVAGSSDVYFEVKKFAQYGKLSKQKIDEMMDQARKESAPGKRDALDFALWKGAKPDEPAWDSPWGPGRPGWHIECSAMNLACLGEQIDIHGGGLDLKFPHHENEIAQSESATGKPFAKYWIHHGLVTAQGQKMSKSLRNFKTLREVKHLSVLKLLFSSTHYSQALDFTDEKMAAQEAVFDGFANFLGDARKADVQVFKKADSAMDGFEDRFRDAMDDDFNTPAALSVMHDVVRYANSQNKPEVLKRAEKWFEERQVILGLGIGATLRVSVVENIRITERITAKVIPVIHDDLEINCLIAERQKARLSKNFKLSDELRDLLLSRHKVVLRDNPDGSVDKEYVA